MGLVVGYVLLAGTMATFAGDSQNKVSAPVLVARAGLMLEIRVVAFHAARAGFS